MIAVHQLSKRFPRPGGGERLAVDAVSFTVSAGEVYGLLGPNGAGKTTTIRMILGLVRPSGGWALLDGCRVDEQPNEAKRRVGLVAAGTGLYQWLTVREMLLYCGELYGLRADATEAEIAQLAPLLGLTDFLEQRCATLSTGQKQRVHLARALIHRPPVLLLDEPTLGLDVIGSMVVTEYVGLLRDRGKAVIITTHRLDEAERLCDRFGLLHQGKLVAEGTLASLRGQTGCLSLTEMFQKLSALGPLLATAPAGGEP